MSKTITIIDTFGFFFRSYYALPPLSNKDGFPTGLLTGFTNFIATLHKEHNSDYIVFALDSKGPTFRNEIDPNYKANRDAPPEELIQQLPIAIEWIEKMGFKTLAQVGFEADDMIASMTKVAKEAGMSVRVVSHDKDLYQLIDDGKVIIVDAIKRKTIDENACMDKFGVKPSQFIDFQSLLGDSADNVPGVKGVGKVTAQKLISNYGSLDEIYKNLELITPKGVKAKLGNDKDNAYMSKKLVTLKNDLFDSVDFEQYKMSGENPFVKIYDELLYYEMNGVVRQLEASGQVQKKQAQSRISSDDVIVETLEEKTSSIEFKKELLVSKNSILNVLNKHSKDEIIAFDTETTGLDFKKDKLVGFSFAFNEDEAFYIPITHMYLGVADQLDINDAKEVIKEIFKFKVVGHNIKFDIHFVNAFLKDIKVKAYADSMILSWLLNPQGQFALDKLALRLLDHEMISFKNTVKKGETFANVHLDDALNYASEDALITLKLYNLFMGKMKLLDSDALLQEANNIEYEFIDTLVVMEENGITLDTKALGDFGVIAKTKLNELTSKIHTLAGSEFNVNSTKQLGVILFETLGLEAKKKTKTGYSTDEKVLNSLYDEHEIIPLLLEYREMQKLNSTYIEPLLDLASKDENSKIYTSFIQTGTATGRLSSKNPNLQNIPVKSELGNKIREAFVARDGYKLLGIDYSQIELRLLAHFSEDKVLVDAFNNGADIHYQTALSLFGEEEAKSKRNIAKTVNFGLLYGMGQKKLAETLKITTKESKEIITKYFESFPSVKSYFRGIVDKSHEDGYVETLFKRRRIFDYSNATPMFKASYEREAVNTVFQGSAADLIKASMNEIKKLIIDEKLDATMLLQIHDELIFEVKEDVVDDISEKFASVMKNISNLNIPLEVSVNVSSSWAGLK